MLAPTSTASPVRPAASFRLARGDWEWSAGDQIDAAAPAPFGFGMAAFHSPGKGDRDMTTSAQRRRTATARPARSPESPRDAPIERYREVRRFTERLCEPLVTEDYVVQSMPDASPAKWHLAHTTLVLRDVRARPARRRTTGRSTRSFALPVQLVLRRRRRAALPRPQRGLLSRPTVAEVYALPRARRRARCWRCWIAPTARRCARARAASIELGLHHEQQHQELI